MSTLQSISEIGELRQQIAQTNAAMNVLNHAALEGKIALRDYLVLVRLLTGGNENLSALIQNMQVTLATIQTLRTATKLLQAEMGPIGWLLLGIGTFAGLTSYSVYSNQTGVSSVR